MNKTGQKTRKKKARTDNVFVNSSGELEDSAILQAFDQAKELYADGAISEAADICLDIWGAVQEFDNLMQRACEETAE